MQIYHDLLQNILDTGEVRDDRTGIGTTSLFGCQLKFNLNDGFPAITTKKLAWKSIVGELLWFIEGSGDERRLAEITHGTRDGVITIWSPNAMAPYWKPKAKFMGDLGRIYGVQWRHWRKLIQRTNGTFNDDFGNEYLRTNTVQVMEVDQLTRLVDGIKSNPYDRRHILTAWNPGEIDEMALPPCHILSQFYVSKDKQLSCHMYQRSVDTFLGLPFNIASYALLTHMIAQVCGLGVGTLIISTGDTHIYHDHKDQVLEQLSRKPYDLPTLWLNPQIKQITDFIMDDIKLENYVSHGQIKAKMAV